MKTSIFPILILVLAPLAGNADEIGKVQVITSWSKPTQCIAPIQVRKIDGREVAVQRMGFWIEPGKHTLSGSAVVDASTCKTIGPDTGRFQAEPLEAEFVPGRVYYIGYDHSSPNRADWKIAIWRIEKADG